MPAVTDIKHPSHPRHYLKLEHPSTPYFCDGCKELGFGRCYRCRNCMFYMHEECAIPSSPTYHHLFEGCRFDFYKRSPTFGDRICDACGKDVKGFLYHCSSRGYDMHPNCAKLPLTLSSEGVTLELKKKASSACQKCRILSGPKSWFYVSTCRRYCLHVACIKEMILEAWKNKYFDQQRRHEINRNRLELPRIASGRERTGHRGRSLSPGREIQGHKGRTGSSGGRDSRIDRKTKGYTNKGRCSSCGRYPSNRGIIKGYVGTNTAMILFKTGIKVLEIIFSVILGVPIPPIMSAAYYFATILFST
ncbi:hypothetical protein P3X46_025540 [Hevea brasiliensis]|uniref:Phorbol-ester/DAG-type domain-containing protein n=1 Tax=Hevea brasiliensis TaxID=3981 RepID=A0ABQ9L989_HEVBR|nr:uncharacterized protein LOC110650674 [Hevea brasiliensis]KAJ9160109.1 hypothetical protein P3X46_025540 [Hevea brasiliensis]